MGGLTYDEVLNYFTVKKKSGHSAQCLCPAHEDKEASLTITEGDDGRVLLYCHAHCQTERVLEAAGLTFADISGESGSRSGRWREYVERREGRKIEADYKYVDLQGRYEFTRLRLSGKKFIYGTLDGDRWTYGLGGRKRATFPAIFTKGVKTLSDAIERGERLYYTEGEKDAQRLISEGLTAFTCGACGDWNPDVASILKGADVVVLADNDDPGKKSARKIVHDLTGIAQRVRMIVPMPDVEHGDVSDFLDAGHTIDDLNQMIENSENMNSEYMNSESGNLDRFHIIDDQGRVKGVFDYAIFQYLTTERDLFVLGGVPYIYDDGCYHADENGSRLKTMIRACCYPEFIKSTTIKRVYDLFIMADELQVTYHDLNQYPAHWINFLNGFYDPVKRKLIPHDPVYKAVNQIPHEYDPNGSTDGAIVEEWLSFIVPDQADREMLLGYAGYCLTRDTRQQKFLILNGEGGTGKSTVIRMIEAMIGSENISNISLSELTQRFASYGLLGKLLNSCADLELQALEDTSTLKKTLGEDTLRGEAKGHDAFSFKSYAKLIFSTNELPVVKAERTNGFYRRLLILPMNRVPEVKRADLFDKLSQEIGYFIRLSVGALERMYTRGALLESTNSIDAVNRLRMDSDTVEAFLNDEVYKVRSARIERGRLYQRYSDYCYSSDRQSLTRNNFYRSMRVKGFTEVKSGGDRYFEGISFEKPALKSALSDGCAEVDEPLPFLNECKRAV